MSKLDNIKKIGKCVGKGLVVAGASVFTLMAAVVSASVEEQECKLKTESYYDAVKSIVESNMLSSYKQEMISMLKHDAEPVYYKTVAEIVKSSMLDSYKIEMIKSLNENEESE